MVTADVLAQVSRLNKVNAGLKFFTSIVLMIISIVSKNPYTGLFLMVIMAMVTVVGGKISLRQYVRFLAAPLSFLILGGLVMLFDIIREPAGILNIRFFSFYFSISRESAYTAVLVISRALGAVSCLYFLSLSTPMTEIIGVLNCLHCPDVIISLSYLIYRYVFILLNMHHTMKSAAKSRLGYESFKSSVKTTGSLYSNLLARSYRQANKNFDALESRGFGTQVRFLENKKQLKGSHALGAAALIVCTLTVFFIGR